MAAEALTSGFEIVALCGTDSWLKAHMVECIDAVYEVTDAELERITLQRSPNQVWILLRRPKEDPFTKIPTGPILALDTLQDPGNLGSIIRTADWFGIRHILCSQGTVSCYNPKVVQSTMGGIFRTNVYYGDLITMLTRCREAGKEVYGALLNGENVYQQQLEKEAVLVIGNESKGISTQVAQTVTKRLTIPNIGGSCESLNAAAAAAILCSEIIRP